MLLVFSPPSPARGQSSPRLELERGVVAVRIRTTDEGAEPARTVAQYQLLAAGRFAVGRETRLALRAGVGTGNGFLGGWNATGLGDGEASWTPYLEQLSLELATASGFTASLGGIAPDQGLISELTGFDSDGYLVGLRLVGRWPGGVVDRLALTLGDLGDLRRSAVLSRLDRIGRVSHGALLAESRFRAIAVTAQLSFLEGETAAQAGVRWRRGVLAIRGEGYLRSDSGRGTAISTSLETGGTTLQAGLVDIRGFTLNGDRYGPGRRTFVSATTQLRAGLQLGGFAMVRIGSAAGLSSRFDLFLRSDLGRSLGLLRH